MCVDWSRTRDSSGFAIVCIGFAATVLHECSKKAAFPVFFGVENHTLIAANRVSVQQTPSY